MTKIKKTVKLATLIEYKNFLSEHLNELNRKIRYNNQVNENRLDEFNIEAMEELKQQYSEDLITIKQKLVRTNLKKLRGDSNPIDYYIYLRSELVRNLNWYGTLLTKINKDGETFERKFKTKVIKFVSRLGKKDITKRQEELSKEITEIDKKLNKFNTTTNVVVEVNVDFE